MIDVRPLDGTAQLIAVAGPADLDVCRALQQTVFSGVRRGCTRIVLDLSGVEAVEPGVLGALLRLRRQLIAMGGGLAVVSSRPTSELFQTRIPDTLLGRAVSVEEARGLLV